MVVLIISLHNCVDCPQYAYIARDVCYFGDYADPFVLTSTEIVQLIEYVCTIFISKLISLGDIILLYANTLTKQTIGYYLQFKLMIYPTLN